MTRQELSSGMRKQIERQVRIAGGISRTHTNILLDHIDILSDLLNEVMCNGQNWGEGEWLVFSETALKLIDGWTVKLRSK